MLSWLGQTGAAKQDFIGAAYLAGRVCIELASTLTEVFPMQARDLCTVPRTLQLARLVPGAEAASCALQQTACGW